MREQITVRASKHASKRIKERCGISKKSANGMCELAVARGIARTDTKGSLRRWLDVAYERHGNGNIFVYGEKAYVLTECATTLITVLNVPNEHKKCIKYAKMQMA